MDADTGSDPDVSSAIVCEVIDRIVFCLESISLDFDRWEDPQVRGPGLYVVIAVGNTIDEYVVPMGTNRWPVETCSNVFDDLDAFYRAGKRVSTECDGAVIVTADGTIREEMVRIHDLSLADLEELGVESIEYDDWMGARHMSALETSMRPDVVATVTLSEEGGRVTVFDDGEYTSSLHHELGGTWRVSADST